MVIVGAMEDSVAQANGSSSDSVRESFMELCRELNMDVESQDTAWASYKKIDQNYVLEVILRNLLYCQLSLVIFCTQLLESDCSDLQRRVLFRSQNECDRKYEQSVVSPSYCLSAYLVYPCDILGLYTNNWI